MSSINNSLLTNNNNISTLSDGKVKKLRKDAKGNLILKKEKKKIKSKFHAHLVDNLYPGKQIAHIIEIESFKKYNHEDAMQLNKEICDEVKLQLKEDKMNFKRYKILNEIWMKKLR